MFLARLTSTIGALWTELMDEIDRNAQPLKQGAVTAVVFAAAAAAMPAMAERGAQQRADAEWNQRALAFQQDMAAEAFGDAHRIEKRMEKPGTQMAMAIEPTQHGWRARAESMLAEDVAEGQAMIVNASLRDSASLASLKPFQPASLRAALKTTREARCLAEAVYYEARSESWQGQMAVAEVVVNRTRSNYYPSTFCGVVYQGHERQTGCQFTFTCDGSLYRQPRGAAWARSEMIAAQVMMGMTRPITHKATHYHTREINPYWSSSLVQTTRIGSHVFYRFPTSSEKHREVVAHNNDTRVLDSEPIA